MADGDFWSGLNIKDIFNAGVGALPLILDKPGANGQTPQHSPTVPPAPVGAPTGLPPASAWLEANKTMVIGGGVVVVLVLVLIMARR